MERKWALLLMLALLGRCRCHIHWMVTENGKIEYQVCMEAMKPNMCIIYSTELRIGLTKLQLHMAFLVKGIHFVLIG